MITRLTDAQEKRLVDVREEWLAVGYDTSPLDRVEATKIIGEFYSRIGKPAPAVMFFSSPAMCVLAWAALRILLKNPQARDRAPGGEPKAAAAPPQLWSQLGSQLWSQLGSQLWSQLWSQLRSQLESQLGSQLESQLGSQLRSQLGSQLWLQLESQLWLQLGSQLGSQLWSQLESQLWSQLRSQLESQLRSQLGSQLESQLGSQLRSQLRSQLWLQLGSQLGSQLWSQLESQLGSQLGSQLWSQLESQLGSQLESQLRSQLRSQLESIPSYFAGGHWSAWEVFYKFCEEIGVRYAAADSDLLDLWLHQSRHLHWWFPFEGIAFASERHTKVRVDAEARLHCQDGPACAYSDGWGVWAWHGLRVDQEIIEEPGKLTGKRILEETNAEVRRVMIERVGMDRFLEETRARVVHSCPDFCHPEQKLELLSIALPGDPEEQIRALRMTDPSTGRKYLLRVPPRVERADDAKAWTFGFEPGKLTVVAET